MMTPPTSLAVGLETALARLTCLQACEAFNRSAGGVDWFRVGSGEMRFREREAHQQAGEALAALEKGLLSERDLWRARMDVGQAVQFVPRLEEALEVHRRQYHQELTDLHRVVCGEPWTFPEGVIPKWARRLVIIPERSEAASLMSAEARNMARVVFHQDVFSREHAVLMNEAGVTCLGRDRQKVPLIFDRPGVAGIHAALAFSLGHHWIRDLSGGAGLHVDGAKVPEGVWWPLSAVSYLRLGQDKKASFGLKLPERPSLEGSRRDIASAENLAGLRKALLQGGHGSQVSDFDEVARDRLVLTSLPEDGGLRAKVFELKLLSAFHRLCDEELPGVGSTVAFAIFKSLADAVEEAPDRLALGRILASSVLVHGSRWCADVLGDSRRARREKAPEITQYFGIRRRIGSF